MKARNSERRERIREIVLSVDVPATRLSRATERVLDALHAGGQPVRYVAIKTVKRGGPLYVVVGWDDHDPYTLEYFDATVRVPLSKLHPGLVAARRVLSE